MKVEITVKVRAGVWLDDTTGLWVGWCPSLDVYSQGRTQGEARNAVEDAALLFVKHCFRRRILDDILGERGFAPSNDGPDPDGEDEFIHIRRVHTEFDRFSFQVPLELIQSARSKTEDGTCPS